MSAKKIEGVKPTRMELLSLRRRVLLAEKGYKLLKEKRDALIAEFLIIIKEVRKCRKKMEGELSSAFKSLIAARALLGSKTVKQISSITEQDLSLDLLRHRLFSSSFLSTIFGMVLLNILLVDSLELSLG